MPIKRMLAVAAATLPMIAGGAQAGDAEGRYAVKGVGLMPCQNFLQMAEQNQPQVALVASWMTGYLSAANMLIDGTYDLVSWQDDAVLINALAAACSQMPQQPVAVASGQLVRGLGPERIETAEQLEQVKVGEQITVMYPSVIRRMQQNLKTRGQSITVDGDFGPGSQNALKAFQTQTGLPATGFPDARTLIALFAPVNPQQASAAPAQPRPQPQPQPQPLDLSPVPPALGGGN